jgi:bacterioferritin-associated ferredoxin
MVELARTIYMDHSMDVYAMTDQHRYVELADLFSSFEIGKTCGDCRSIRGFSPAVTQSRKR